MVFDELEKIKNIQGTNNKKELLKEWYNKDSKVCKEIMNFLYNPNIITNLSTKKIKKTTMTNDYIDTDDIKILTNENIFYIIKYLTESCTGTDKDISIIQRFRDRFYYSQSKDFFELFVCKELNIGLDIKNINSVISDCIELIEPMLAYNYNNVSNDINLEDEWYITVKLDGNRLIIDNRKEKPLAYTRNGILLKDLDDFLSNINLPKGYIYDGELLPNNIDGKTSKEQYKEISSIMRTKGEKDKNKIKYHIFDIIDYSLLYKERRKIIDKIPNSKYVNICKVLHKGPIKKQVFDLLDKLIDSGEEGLMANHENGLYVPKRTKDIIKFKKFHTLDLKCIGIEEGTKRFKKTLGSIICEYKGNIVKIGSGFTEKQRNDIWNDNSLVLNKIIEIKYFEETEDKDGNKSIRFPVFQQIRDDKTEVSYE